MPCRARLDAGGAQFRVQAALDNAKQVLLLRPAMRGYAAIQPARRTVRGFLEPALYSACQLHVSALSYTKVQRMASCAVQSSVLSAGSSTASIVCCARCPRTCAVHSRTSAVPSVLSAVLLCHLSGSGWLRPESCKACSKRRIAAAAANSAWHVTSAALVHSLACLYNGITCCVRRAAPGAACGAAAVGLSLTCCASRTTAYTGCKIINHRSSRKS